MPPLCEVFYKSFDNLDGLVLMEKETVIESVSLVDGKVKFIQLIIFSNQRQFGICGAFLFCCLFILLQVDDSRIII